MKSRLRSDLKQAMRRKDQGEISLLRTMLGAIDNAEAVPVGARHDKYHVAQFGDGSAEAPRRGLTQIDLNAVFEAEANSRIEAAEQFARAGHPDRAAALRREAEVVRRYLTV